METFAELDPPMSGLEARFLRHILDRLRKLEARTRGLYAEILVADHLPGSVLPDRAASPHDIEWNGLTLAVRTTGSRNADHTREYAPYGGSWTFKPVIGTAERERRKCWADVVVLLFHDGFDLGEGWHFCVVSAEQLEQDLPQRVTPAGLRSRGINPVEAAELPQRVVAAIRPAR